MGQYDPDIEESVSSETDQEVDEPPMYKVMLLNDDYTTMEFVVEVLEYVFQKSPEECAPKRCRGLRYLPFRDRRNQSGYSSEVS